MVSMTPKKKMKSGMPPLQPHGALLLHPKNLKIKLKPVAPIMWLDGTNLLIQTQS
jgi:hypothetical protein